MFDLMFAPFVACLILAGIHAYLGIHVVERGVIFVDLALAQIAALGGIVAVLLGAPLHSTPAYLWSLGFTILAAGLFAVMRSKDKGVPQEALIGIVYVVAAAAAVIVLEKVPKEAQHIKEMLVGNILFVDWAQVGKTLLLYGVVGGFHYAFRKRFIQISTDPEKARQQGISIRWWDFLFYASFGVVVTSSVELAGVLLVFSFLIIPAVCAMLFTRDFRKRLVLGWTFGAVGSLAGVYASAVLDWPTGAAVVCVFGVMALGVGVIQSTRSRLP